MFPPLCSSGNTQLPLIRWTNKERHNQSRVVMLAIKWVIGFGRDLDICFLMTMNWRTFSQEFIILRMDVPFQNSLFFMKDDKTSFQRQNIQGMIIISAYPINGLLSRSLVECKTKTVCDCVWKGRPKNKNYNFTRHAFNCYLICDLIIPFPAISMTRTCAYIPAQ